MYILGAGASIGAYRLPKYEDSFHDKRMLSGENFFYDLHYSEKEFPSGFHFINLLGAMYEGLDRLLHQTYKINSQISFFDEKPWKGLNIESVFTHLDIGTKMYARGTAYRNVFVLAKESLIRYVTLALIMRSSGQRCGYLSEIFSALSDRDTVVSFNWDTIADVTLEFLGKQHLDNYVGLITGNKKPTSLFTKPMFLKLHGSLNWALCRNKRCSQQNKNIFINSDAGKISEVTLSNYQKCPECDSNLEINIILLLSDKVDIHKKNLFSNQWNIARRKLQQTKKLVFIGYSFPATDSYAEWLFRQINYLVEDMESLTFTKIDIEVVNPAALRRNSALRKRYTN